MAHNLNLEPQWAAFAAIDWADQTHVWQLQPAGTNQTERGQIPATPENIETWALQLRERFHGRPIAVCLEQSRGGLVYQLIRYPHLVLFPVHPTVAAQYRRTFTPSGAKNDPGDAAALLDLLLRHRERLTILQPDTAETRLLQMLSQPRRKLVDERTGLRNRLQASLKQYFPQVLQWFDDPASPLVDALLKRWPRMQQLQRTQPGILRKFFHQHNCRNEKRIEERIQAIYAAVPVTSDEAVLEAGELAVQAMLAMIRTLDERLAILEKRLQEVTAHHPDAAIFHSFPGAGKALVPRLIAAFGTERGRFGSASELQCFSGIAPVTKASGKSRSVEARFFCPQFLKQTFHEFALHSLAHCEWAKAYYDYLRKEKHKGHHAAVRALAYKWIRIMFRCWQDRTPYDEETYLKSLRRRSSQFAGALQIHTSAGWIAVGGFQKFSAENA